MKECEKPKRTLRFVGRKSRRTLKLKKKLHYINVQHCLLKLISHNILNLKSEIKKIYT